MRRPIPLLVLTVFLASVCLFFFVLPKRAHEDRLENGAGHAHTSTDGSTRARVIAPTLLGTTRSMADPPHYEREPLDDNSPFFRTDGILSYRVVDAMGLTKEQALAVQAAYTGFLDEIAALATERLTIDYENFDQDLGVTAFVIGAFGDKVESAFSSLRDSLAHTLGNETSESFCESIRKNDSYPGWGEYELRLQVKEAWDEPAAALIDIDIVDEHGNIIEHIDQGYEARPGIFQQQGVMHKIFEITDPDATIFGSQSSTESN